MGRGDGYRGRLRFANRPYSTLLVPGPSETPSRMESSLLAEARDAGLASAETWEAGQIPSLPPLAVATTMRR